MRCTIVAVLGLTVTSTTRAAECTQSQLASYDPQANADKLMTDCAESISLSSNVMPAKEFCTNDKCVAAIKWLMANTPDCSVGGENFKTKYLDQFSTILNGCPSPSEPLRPSTTVPSTTTAPSNTTSISSASAVAAVGWTVAAAAIAVLTQL